MIGAWRRAWDSHPHVMGAGLVVLAALLASFTSLGNGFALDDIPVIQERGALHTLREPFTLLTTAYWQLPPADTLWRPLGLLAFALQWVAGDGAPIVFHGVSIALYASVSLAVFALARSVLSAEGALVAALVFAVHPVHVESVGNIVGQLELWVALMVVAACALYLRARRQGTIPLGTMAVLLGCYAVALGMKEHAVLLPAFLLALELTVLRDAPAPSADVRARRRVLFGLFLTLAILWLSVRSELLGGLAGDRPHVALKGLGAGERAWVMLGLLPEIARLLVWPARLYADYSPQLVDVHARPGVAHLPGAMLLLVYVVALQWSWRRDRALALGFLWMPLALVLVANLLVPTGILLAERTLFLGTVGIALVAGALVPRVARFVSAMGPTARTAGGVSSIALLLLAAAHSAERQHVWRDNDALMTSLLIEAPSNFRGHFWFGHELLLQGRMIEGEGMMRRAMALWPEHEGPPLGLALRYQEYGMCEPALSLYEAARRLEPSKPASHFGYGGCLLALGRLHEARRAAFQGLETGRSGDAFRYLILQVDSALFASDSTEANNWWVRRHPRP